MDDVKRTYREAEESTKEAWRNRDGEDLADKVGNIGDHIRKDAGNAGDAARRRLDDARRELRDRSDTLTGDPVADHTGARQPR